MSSVKMVLGGILLVLGGVGLWFGLDWMNKVLPGTGRQAHFIAGSLVISDSTNSYLGSATYGRVHVHDPATGVELARKLFNGDCIPTTSAQLWCYDPGPSNPNALGGPSLSLRRLDTLAVLADDQRIVQLNPPLAAGLKLRDPPKVDLTDRALLVAANDGRIYRIDATMSARPEPNKVHSAVAFGHGASGSAAVAKVAGQRMMLQADGAGARKTVAIAPPSVDQRAAFGPHGHNMPNPLIGVVHHPELSFLDPTFLADERGEALVLADPPGTVLSHYDSQVPGQRRLLWSRLDLDGNVVWSHTTSSRDILCAEVVGDRIVIVLSNRIIALDAKTGALRYTHSF